MATKKVDKHVVWEDSSPVLQITSSSDSTASKTLKAFLIDEAGTEIQIGTVAGAAADTQINLTLDLYTATITAGKWYELKVATDLATTPKIGILPNPSTANKIMLYILPIPTDA